MSSSDVPVHRPLKFRSTRSRGAPINVTMDERFHDAACWARAWEHLMALLGRAPDDLVWDDRHHLQGHAHVGGRELVVIAARDTEHHVLILTPEDWDEIRHAPAEQRGELLRRCAIRDRHRLGQVLHAA